MRSFWKRIRGVLTSMPLLLLVFLGTQRRNTNHTRGHGAAASDLKAKCCLRAPDGREYCIKSRAKPYTIAFYSNHLGYRGTEVALYDYADQFEKLLCGRAYVTAPQKDINPSVYHKFRERFGPDRLLLFNPDRKADVYQQFKDEGVDAVYMIIMGTERSVTGSYLGKPPSIFRLLVHGVFFGTQPVGDAYVTISDSVPRVEGVPVVPHMATLDPAYEHEPDMRSSWGIPRQARVYCRHGGADTFGIEMARQAVCKHAQASPSDHFVFLGPLDPPLPCTSPNVHMLPASGDPRAKRAFLNTCDACVHARMDGETFGLAVAECALAGLPVMTYGTHPPCCDHHLRVLGPHALRYTSLEELLGHMGGFDKGKAKAKAEVYSHLYDQFGPHPVMLLFVVTFGLWGELFEGRPPHLNFSTPHA